MNLPHELRICIASSDTRLDYRYTCKQVKEMLQQTVLEVIKSNFDLVQKNNILLERAEDDTKSQPDSGFWSSDQDSSSSEDRVILRLVIFVAYVRNCYFL